VPGPASKVPLAPPFRGSTTRIHHGDPLRRSITEIFLAGTFRECRARIHGECPLRIIPWLPRFDTTVRTSIAGNHDADNPGLHDPTTHFAFRLSHREHRLRGSVPKILLADRVRGLTARPGDSSRGPDSENTRPRIVSSPGRVSHFRVSFPPPAFRSPGTGLRDLFRAPLPGNPFRRSITEIYYGDPLRRLSRLPHSARPFRARATTAHPSALFRRQTSRTDSQDPIPETYSGDLFRRFFSPADAGGRGRKPAPHTRDRRPQTASPRPISYPADRTPQTFAVFWGRIPQTAHRAAQTQDGGRTRKPLTADRTGNPIFFSEIRFGEKLSL